MRIPYVGYAQQGTPVTDIPYSLYPGCSFQQCLSDSVNYTDWTNGETVSAGTSREVLNGKGSAYNFGYSAVVGHTCGSSSKPEVGGPAYWWPKAMGIVAPCAGTFRHLIWKLTAQLGNPYNLYSYFVKNDAAQGLGVYLGSTDTNVSDLANELAVAAGDRIRVRAHGLAGATYYPLWGVAFEPSTPGLIPFWGNASNIQNGYASIMGGCTSTEVRSQMVVPVAGKFRNFYMDFGGSISAGQTGTCCLRKNGVNTALSLSWTGTGLYGLNNRKSDTSTEVAFAAGDLASLCFTQSGYSAPFFGICFVPDNPDVWWIGRPFAYTNLSTSTVYSTPCVYSYDSGTTWTSEIACPFPGGIYIDGIAVKLDSAPGTGNSRTFTLRKNWADTGIAVTVAGSSTWGILSGATRVPIAHGDCLSVRATSSASVSGSRASFSLLGGTIPTPLGAASTFVPRSIPALYIAS